MNKIFFLFFAFSSTLLIAQQGPSPVKWKFNLVSKGENKAEFSAVATINPGWNIYAVYMSDEGPIPTSFTFEKVEHSTLDGKVMEKSKAIKGFDPLFDMEVVKFKETAEFTQMLALAQGGSPTVSGYVTYMCCDSQRCLPPVDVPFSVKL